MASVEDCERALHALALRLAEIDPDLRARHAVDRTLSCRVVDLDVVFAVRIQDGVLSDLTCTSTDQASPRAQVRLTTSSDDLVALTDGSLTAPLAWATGRLKIEASVRDLLRLRSLL